MNIRALTKLFEVAAERFPDVKYDIKVTLLEIYNEKIQDLLGEKGRTLKAVQGQYGMEVQDLTSETHYTRHSNSATSWRTHIHTYRSAGEINRDQAPTSMQALPCD